MSERILSKKDTEKFDEIYNYIKNYHLNKLRSKINEFKTNINQPEVYPKDFDLVEKLKQTGKMSEYESEGKRYNNFYKRVLDGIHINCEENRKLLIKEELVKLKNEVNVDTGIELTANEIEELIKIIDKIIDNSKRENDKMLNQEQINDANKMVIKMAELSKSTAILKNKKTNEVQELVIESIDLNNKVEDRVIVKIVDSNNNKIAEGIYDIFITTKIVNFETLQYVFDKQTTLRDAKIINIHENSFVIDKDNIIGDVIYISADK